MGPRSCERGNKTHGTPQSASPTLQWGRARASAEIRAAHYRLVCPLRFNGAALVRARKCFSSVTTTERLSLLQWGRARASAEMKGGDMSEWPEDLRFNGAALVRARKSTAFFTIASSRNVASMGPRSCERGNLGVMHEGAERAVQLQWGRARASAEMARL